MAATTLPRRLKAVRAARIAVAVTVVALQCLFLASPAGAQLLPGFRTCDPFGEQEKWTRLDTGIRVYLNAPAKLQRKSRTLVLFATPNGNTIEQSLGCAASKQLDWRFDIQHIAAQARRWRELDANHDHVLAIVEAPKLSWPTFRREQTTANSVIRDLVASLTREVSAERVILTCHSGGGSFLFGYLDSVDSLPGNLDRIVFLDANYAYSDSTRHGDKLWEWLKGDATRRLVVVAYDDREITLNGKKVVGPEGGTFRATQRMLARFRRDTGLTERTFGPFQHTSGLDGQIQFFVHPNPDNKILHTALVGDMNGMLHALALGTEFASTCGQLGGPRAYAKWIQPQPFIDPATARAEIPADAPEVRLALPPRPATAPTGSQFRQQIADLPRERREAAILREIASGNVPEFLRRLTPIRVAAHDEAGAKHVATYYVTSDYLAVGTDEDFFRVPMSPATATALADKFDALLITTKVSDDIFAAAPVKLDPQPLTKDRDAVSAFWQHQELIEEQLRGQPRDALVAGIKKDVVLTNRLREKPHRVAIYGWHYPHGRPIQPLYVGHVDWYVDYSHGIRWMSQQVVVDGQKQTAAEVLKNSRLCRLLSSEGPLDVAEIRQASAWGP